MTKRAADPWDSLPPSDRLERKVRTFGDDALLDLEEISVLWGCGLTSATNILEPLPCVQPSPRVKRWRYGKLREHMRTLEESEV